MTFYKSPYIESAASLCVKPSPSQMTFNPGVESTESIYPEPTPRGARVGLKDLTTTEKQRGCQYRHLHTDGSGTRQACPNCGGLHPTYSTPTKRPTQRTITFESISRNVQQGSDSDETAVETVFDGSADTSSESSESDGTPSQDRWKKDLKKEKRIFGASSDANGLDQTKASLGTPLANRKVSPNRFVVPTTPTAPTVSSAKASTRPPNRSSALASRILPTVTRPDQPAKTYGNPGHASLRKRAHSATRQSPSTRTSTSGEPAIAKSNGPKRPRSDVADQSSPVQLLREEVARILQDGERRATAHIAQLMQIAGDMALSRRRLEDEIAAAFQRYDESCKGPL